MANFSNNKSYTLVLGTSDDDKIDNNVGNVTIDAGAGNDSIENWQGDIVSIDGGAGNDDIYSSGASVSVGGGDGNDNIYIEGSRVTIKGGTGNDTIEIDSSEIASSNNPEETLNQKVNEYTEKFANPYIAASRGFVDDVILPSESRMRILGAFGALQTKAHQPLPKKHGNIPL